MAAMFGAVVFLAIFAAPFGHALTMEDANANPEILEGYVDLSEFNPWYHAGIALVILYVMLSCLIATVNLVTHMLGNRPRRSS